jgi:hypothetical protein
MKGLIENHIKRFLGLFLSRAEEFYRNKKAGKSYEKKQDILSTKGNRIEKIKVCF